MVAAQNLHLLAASLSGWLAKGSSSASFSSAPLSVSCMSSSSASGGRAGTDFSSEVWPSIYVACAHHMHHVGGQIWALSSGIWPPSDGRLAWWRFPGLRCQFAYQAMPFGCAEMYHESVQVLLDSAGMWVVCAQWVQCSHPVQLVADPHDGDCGMALRAV